MTNKPGHYRWAICSLLFFATTINYLDRQVVGYLKPILEKQFNWTETDYSHIVMAFTAAYAVGLLLFGRIIDKIGSKFGYTISIAIWSIAAMLHAVVRTTLGFGIVRATLGLGESGNFPSAIKTVVEWFPKKERALATGFFDSGANIGAGTITFSLPYLFRTPPGVNLWVKGMSNYFKDGIQPLEGVVEADWPASTFTMNWKFTRANEWVSFEVGEPICMIVPIPRGFSESLIPRIEPLKGNAELHKQYLEWEASRSGFLKGLKTNDPDAVKQGWQKDYFQGKTPDGASLDEMEALWQTAKQAERD